MTYAISTHSSWAEMSLTATDGSNRVGEQSPQPGKAGMRGHSGGSSENCVRHCNPPHAAGMNLRSFFFFKSFLWLPQVFLAAWGGLVESVRSSALGHGLSTCAWAPGHVDSVAAACRLSCPGTWGLSSLNRDRTFIPCIARRILNHWATREVPELEIWTQISWNSSDSPITNPPLWEETTMESDHTHLSAELLASGRKIAHIPTVSYFCAWHGKELRC